MNSNLPNGTNEQRGAGRPRREDGVIGIVRQAMRDLQAAGIPIEASPRAEKRYVDIFRKGRSEVLRARFVTGDLDPKPSLTSRLLKNIIILHELYLFEKSDFERLLQSTATRETFDAKLSSALDGVRVHADGYRLALVYADPIRAAFHEHGNLEDVDLAQVLSSPSSVFEHVVIQRSRDHQGGTPHALQELERIRESDAYQDAEPRALARAAACYLKMGALVMASALVAEALERDPAHPYALLLEMRIHLQTMGNHGEQANVHRVMAADYHEGDAAYLLHQQIHEDHLEAYQASRSRLYELCIRVFDVMVHALTAERDDFDLDGYSVAVKLERTVVETLLTGWSEYHGSLDRAEIDAVRLRAARHFLARFIFDEPKRTLLELRAIDLMRRLGDEQHRAVFLALVERVRDPVFPQQYSFLFSPPSVDDHGSSEPASVWIRLCEDILGKTERDAIFEEFHAAQLWSLRSWHRQQRGALVIRDITHRIRCGAYQEALALALERYPTTLPLFRWEERPSKRQRPLPRPTTKTDVFTYLTVSLGLLAVCDLLAHGEEERARELISCEPLAPANIRASWKFYEDSLSCEDFTSNLPYVLDFGGLWLDHDFWSVFDGSHDALFEHLRANQPRVPHR